MGKNLKGKECGRGIYQRKDGLYSARYNDSFGKRKEQYFKTLPEARNWLEDARYEDKHGIAPQHTEPTEYTVDSWFRYWLENLICDRAPNTRRNYEDRYKHNIQPIIGSLPISQVKPMHCKVVLNRMEERYAGSTIKQTYITMGSMFRAAVMNDIITKHPMDGVRYSKPCRASDDIKFMTLDE